MVTNYSVKSNLVVDPVLYAVDFPTTQANPRAIGILYVVVADCGTATPTANP